MAEFENSNVNPQTAEHRTVRLTLISRHILPDMSRMRGMKSLFEYAPPPKKKNAPVTPENYPEEMDEALRVIRDNDAGADSRFGFDDYEDFDPEYDGEENDDIMQKIEEFAKFIAEADEPDKDITDNDDAFVFKTLASMTRRILPDGSEEIEIAYDEHDSMDKTRTVILYNTSNPSAVSIFHEGDVTSSIVCEKGVRHFSVYNTPVMPFELAVLGRKCVGELTYDNGGELEIDYIVEIRGADVQRTIMRIYADIL